MEEEISGNSGFTKRYNDFLAEFKLTPKGLADELGDSGHVKYNNYQKGLGKPSAETLMEISAKYNISIDWMLLGIGTMIRPEVQEAVYMKGPESGQPVRQLSIKEDKAASGRSWKDESEHYRKKFEILTTRMLAINHPDVFTDELVKPWSNGHTTDAYRLPIGFQLSAIQKEQAVKTLSMFDAYIAAGMNLINEMTMEQSDH